MAASSSLQDQAYLELRISILLELGSGGHTGCGFLYLTIQARRTKLDIVVI